MTRPVSVVQIHVECRPVRDQFDARIGALAPLVPRWAANRYIHGKFFPNNVLRWLHRRGALRYRPFVLPYQASYGASDFRRLPGADVWLFSLQNWQHTAAFSADVLADLRDKAARQGICPVNLCSHIDDGALAAPLTPPAHPKIAKLRGNGLVGGHDPASYAILATPEAERDWRAARENVADYVVQPWIEDRRSDPDTGLYVIERWIVIGDDITVGLRRAFDPIVKQSNAVTSYLRDARKIADEPEFGALRAVLDSRMRRAGSVPLSFHYLADDGFWDRRYAVMRQHRGTTGFSLGSVDAIETAAGEIVMIDYNEHTFESAHVDLMTLWADRLEKHIWRKQAACG